MPKFKYPTPEDAYKRIAEIKQRDAQWCWLMEVKAKVQEKKIQAKKKPPVQQPAVILEQIAS